MSQLGEWLVTIDANARQAAITDAQKAFVAARIAAHVQRRDALRAAEAVWLKAMDAARVARDKAITETLGGAK